MAEAAVEIPKRALFRAAEVCEIASVQPYVLRSWELEFPSLGVAKAEGATRVYRRADLERVLRIKQLVFGEGLTLAGARRRIEEEGASPSEEAPLEELLGRSARERLAEVKRGLRSILDLLSGNGHAAKAADFQLTTPRPVKVKNARAARAVKPAARMARKKTTSGRAHTSGRR